MTDKTFYLSGAITNVSERKANAWRLDLKKRLEELDEHIHVYNPMQHFSYDDLKNKKVTDFEIMDQEIFKLRKSTLVIVNFDHARLSLGTMAELAIAYEKCIPVIGLNETNEELHPWQRLMTHKIFSNKEEMILYIADHFIKDD